MRKALMAMRRLLGGPPKPNPGKLGSFALGDVIRHCADRRLYVVTSAGDWDTNTVVATRTRIITEQTADDWEVVE